MKYTFDKLNGGHTWDITSLVSFNNGYLVSSSFDRNIIIWDYLNQKVLFKLDSSIGGHNRPIQSICLLENQYLSSAGTDGVIKVWDISISD